MINRMILTGRVTKDVEVRKTQSGLSVASFTVATDRIQKDANGNNVADFFNCVAWRHSADFLGQYCRKGNMVAVEGRLQNSSFQRQDGSTGYVTEIQCDNVQIMESRPQNVANTAPQSNYSNTQANYQPNNYNAQNASNQPQNAYNDTGFDISNDDLPF